MNALQKSKFRVWTKKKLAKVFGLQENHHFSPLQQWLASIDSVALTDFEQQYLSYLRKQAALHISSWNEEDLKMNVLGPIISLADFPLFDANKAITIARHFFEERLEGVLGNYALSGRPDLVIAMGDYEPKAPYFCFHEYKQQEADGSPNDPAGQALIAMLVAQELNEGTRPIYGAYVTGRNWYFMALQGKQYGISDSYLLTQESIFDVLKGLKQLKVMIQGFIQEDLKTQIKTESF